VTIPQINERNFHDPSHNNAGTSQLAKTCCAHHVVGFWFFFVWESGLVYIFPIQKWPKMLRNKGLSRFQLDLPSR
jgi:hypothetical protein